MPEGHFAATYPFARASSSAYPRRDEQQIAWFREVAGCKCLSAKSRNASQPTRIIECYPGRMK